MQTDAILLRFQVELVVKQVSRKFTPNRHVQPLPLVQNLRLILSITIYQSPSLKETMDLHYTAHVSWQELTAVRNC